MLPQEAKMPENHPVIKREDCYLLFLLTVLSMWQFIFKNVIEQHYILTYTRTHTHTLSTAVTAAVGRLVVPVAPCGLCQCHASWGRLDRGHPVSCLDSSLMWHHCLWSTATENKKGALATSWERWWVIIPAWPHASWARHASSCRLDHGGLEGFLSHRWRWQHCLSSTRQNKARESETQQNRITVS